MKATSTKHAVLIDDACRQVAKARGDIGIRPAQAGRDPGMFEFPPAYQVLRVIHAGGQGVVYEATQSSTGRTVAVKIMRDGVFASVNDRLRFEREVQILGQLDHPNIVRIIDSGEFAGRLFFVMDYIDGVPLNEFGKSHAGPDDRRGSGQDQGSRGLGLRDALLLFAHVCDAVHAAHLRGVIHRDLKPGNILIDSGGRPHVLDFGLAKRFTLDGFDSSPSSSMTAMTETGQFLGSLPWASPEQVSADSSGIDIRSDVYSLGVILYQMLTGAFPYAVTGSIRQVTDNILTVDPARPSLVSAAINDEVQTIVLKALSKAPDRRYQSARDLSLDVQRYLGGELIEAKRDSLSYVLRKQLRRHWIPVTVGAAFIAVITAGLITSLSLWRSAVIERDQKDSQRATAESINAVLHNMLASANPEVSSGREVTVAQVLETAASEIEAGSLNGHPEVEASVRLTLGEAYLALGKLEPAEAHLLTAVALCERTHGGKHFDSALCLAALGRLRLVQGDYTAAAARLREALAIAEETGNQSRRETLPIMMSLAGALNILERRDEGRAMHERALDLVTRLYGENHPETARVKIEIATSRIGGPQGVALLREELRINRETLGPTHPEVVRTLRRLAAELHLKGEYDEAERTYLEAIELSREIYGEDHHEIIHIVTNLAWLYNHTEQRSKSIALLKQYDATARAVFGPESVRYAEYLNMLGVDTLVQGDIEEAKAVLQKSLDVLMAIKRDQSWQGAEARNYLALAHLRQEHYPQAESLARETISITQEKSDRMDPRRALAQAILGQVLTVRGEFEQAESLLLESDQVFEARPSMSGLRQRVIKGLIKLYETWDAAEPGTGRGEQAAHWRALETPARTDS